MHRELGKVLVSNTMEVRGALDPEANRKPGSKQEN
jgi:hypothetical protein